ncbi:SGNH hydrolase domain-containing protein [Corticibacterium sp. UT-5YL-CI-8]|nr:SGNH hydrolase domain-containing protein [Tianweitania sp. UT-5YL-CI-8]
MRERRGLNASRIAKISKSNTSPRVLVIGDSHSYDVVSALFENGVRDFSRFQISAVCQPAVGPRPKSAGERGDASCQQQFSKILNSTKLKQAKVVILAARWRGWAARRLPKAVEAIRKNTNAQIIVFDPTIEFSPILPTIAEAYGSTEGLNEHASKLLKARPIEVNTTLRKAAAAKVMYVDKITLLCGKDRVCPALIPGSTVLLTFDYGHWTLVIWN